jgi:NADPH:quinone reductase-like Zn-dependent oxidoreductase
MRAIVITTPGGPEVLRLEEVPDPVPGPGEALVEVTAAAIVAGVRADIWPLDDGTHVGRILLVN